MKEQKKRIVVIGNVQGVGYRFLVKQIAHSLGIKGYVQNLEDGSVEIYVQAPIEAFNIFIKKIDVKRESEDNFFFPNVESLTIFRDSDSCFRPVKGAFRAFWIKYGERLSEGEKEIIEKTETGGLMLTSINAGLKSFRVKSKENSESVNSHLVNLNGELHGFRQESKEAMFDISSQKGEFKLGTKENFAKLDNKYDSVSNYLEKINMNIEKLNNTIEKVAQKLVG